MVMVVVVVVVQLLSMIELYNTNHTCTTTMMPANQGNISSIHENYELEKRLVVW